MKIDQIYVSSRRQFFKTSLTAVLGGLSLAGCATFGLPRLAKASAGYTDRSKGPGHCHDCVHFTAPNSCSIVEGDINPGGVCRYFLGTG